MKVEDEEVEEIVKEKREIPADSKPAEEEAAPRAFFISAILPWPMQSLKCVRTASESSACALVVVRTSI